MELFNPCGWRILVEVIKPETPKTVKELKKFKDSGFYIPEETEKFMETETNRHVGGSERGKVVAMGEYCFKAHFVTKPWCKIGDTILFMQYAGRQLKDKENPDRVLRIINDEDVLCTVREE